MKKINFLEEKYPGVGSDLEMQVFFSEMYI